MRQQPPRGPAQALRPLRLWIDTDVGTNPDDAVALALAAALPGVEVVAVSTPTSGPPAPDAADALLAIGPLTNVAAAAELPPLVVVMGGALVPVRHRGALRDVETNFGSDPAAARAVVERCPELVLVPLDVTSRMVLDDEEVSDLRSARPDLAAELDSWPHDVCLHDPLALLVLVGEAPGVVVEKRPLGVDAGGRVTPEGPRRRVVVDADTEAARRRVVEVLERHGPPG